MLQINNFSVGIKEKIIVDSLTLEIGDGEVVGLVGESGSGKSMTALGIMGLLPHTAEVMSGEILLDSRNLLAKSAQEMRNARQGYIDDLSGAYDITESDDEGWKAAYGSICGSFRKIS